ncbi:MAG: hypothetical protein II595_06230, partial [Desulfovibrio sp.]|nr:hypothetical protein [Desulfovibrio sp.]
HDLYALGMVLYWLLNDKRVPYAPPSPAPISAADLAIARDMRLRGDPMPVPAHGSSELQRVIMRAIADRPEDRYRTADEFRSALLAVVQASDDRRAQEERAQRAAALRAQQAQQAQAREARMQRDAIEEDQEEKRSILPIVLGSICGLVVLAVALVLILGSIGSKKTNDDDKGAVHEEKVFQPLGVAEGELEEFQSCRRRLHFLMAVPALNRRLGYGGHGTGGCLQHALSPCLVDRGKARDGQRLAVAVGVPVYGA